MNLEIGPWTLMADFLNYCHFTKQILFTHCAFISCNFVSNISDYYNSAAHYDSIKKKSLRFSSLVSFLLNIVRGLRTMQCVTNAFHLFSLQVCYVFLDLLPYFSCCWWCIHLFCLFHLFMLLLLLWIWTGRLTPTPGKRWPQAKYLNLQHWVLEWVWDQPSHFRNLPVGRLHCLSVSHSVVPSAVCHPTSHSLFCQQFVSLIVCTWEIALWLINKYWNQQNGCSREIKVSRMLGHWNTIGNICCGWADTYEKKGICGHKFAPCSSVLLLWVIF